MNQVTEQELITKAVAPRVTKEAVDENIVGEFYFTALEGTLHSSANDTPSASAQQTLGLLTFCVLVLKNDFTVTGESACASPENYNAEIGRRLAYSNAVNKIWPLMGYELRSQLAAQANAGY